MFLRMRKSLLILFSVVLLCITLLSPAIHYRLGTLFFGTLSPLYNITLARFFFKQASHPLFGKIPQHTYYQLSRVNFIEGNLVDAVIYANKELALYPESVKTYYILGLTLGYMNKEEKAIEMFSNFLEHKPTSWAARNDKAWLQFRLGDIDGALETILPIVSIQYYNPWIQNTYCALLINKKEWVTAKDVCDRAKWLIEAMTEKTWGSAYPGNDPRIYETGVEAMKASIEKNVALLKKYTN